MANTRNHTSIEALDQLLRPKARRRLTADEIKEFSNTEYEQGWEFRTDLTHGDRQLSLWILVGENFPYQFPDAYVRPEGLETLSYPHIEKAGKLCVWPPEVCVSDVDVGYVIEFINDAQSLLSDTLSGRCDDDYRNGFVSYWGYHSTIHTGIVSLCRASDNKTREIYSYRHGRLGTIFGDTPQDIVDWVTRYSGWIRGDKKELNSTARIAMKIQPSALFCLDSPWAPAEYPETVQDLEAMLVPHTLDQGAFAQLIASAMDNRKHPVPAVLVRFPHEVGACFAGVVFDKGLFSQRSRHDRRPVITGVRHAIRDGHLLSQVRQVRARGAMVDRADHAWIFSRDPTKQHIKAASIAIIGCGSIGSYVARLLSQSGVGKLVLVDGESLGYENLPRHHLGANQVGQNKASALAESIASAIPVLEVSHHSKNWQELQTSTTEQGKAFREDIEACELILSATADWQSDLALIRYQEEDDLGPIVFAFTEPHAFASHVIVHPSGSGAYQALHHTVGDSVGALRWPCTRWEQETQVSLPTCGGTFQPYGAIAIHQLHGIATKLILDLILGNVDAEPQCRILIGFLHDLGDLGGEIAPEWEARFGQSLAENRCYTLHLKDAEWELADDEFPE